MCKTQPGEGPSGLLSPARSGKVPESPLRRDQGQTGEWLTAPVSASHLRFARRPPAKADGTLLAEPPPGSTDPGGTGVRVCTRWAVLDLSHPALLPGTPTGLPSLFPLIGSLPGASEMEKALVDGSCDS